jgi:hypothetical protein
MHENEAVYAHESLSPTDVFGDLIANYRPPAKMSSNQPSRQASQPMLKRQPESTGELGGRPEVGSNYHWCAWCGKMTDHGSGSCPDLKMRTKMTAPQPLEKPQQFPQGTRGWSFIHMPNDGTRHTYTCAYTGYRRYEAIRKLNPQQFAELYARNLKGERFDDLVDELIPD